MSTEPHHTHGAVQRSKRELRMEIARRRRRVSRAVTRSIDEARQLGRWQTYVRRFPAQSLAAAFGLGWLLAGTGGPGAWSRRIGHMALRAAGESAWAAVRSGIFSYWSRAESSFTASEESSPPSPEIG